MSSDWIVVARASLRRACRVAGGGAALAHKLGVRRQAVYQWDLTPVRRVLAVEAFTGVPRYELRPDVYGVAEVRGPDRKEMAEVSP